MSELKSNEILETNSQLKINNEDDINAEKTYQMRPKLSETFKTSEIKTVIRRILVNRLQGKTYDSMEAKTITREIADEVNQAVRELDMRRYKHVVQVIIGQELGSGCRYIARCRWDAECDNQASEAFSNSSLFCICTVFGIYLY